MTRPFLLECRVAECESGWTTPPLDARSYSPPRRTGRGKKNKEGLFSGGSAPANSAGTPPPAKFPSALRAMSGGNLTLGGAAGEYEAS